MDMEILYSLKRVREWRHSDLPDSPGVPEGIAKNTITVPIMILRALKYAFEQFGDDYRRRHR